MQKHEVLNLLERFPDLVDSDDLLCDLFQQATNDAPGDDWKAPKTTQPVGGKDRTEDLPRRPH